MQRDSEDGHRVPQLSGKSSVTFGTEDDSRLASVDIDSNPVDLADARLAAKTQQMLERIKRRDSHFRRAVMADSAMGVMLSLFFGELASIPLTESNLALTNMLEGSEARRVIESLIHAGLVVLTGANPERHTVGLTPLGSARMRSFVSDYPDA